MNQPTDNRTIHQRLASLMRKIGAIGKGGQVEFGKTKYAYRSLEDVVNRSQPLLAEEGIFVSSKIVDSSVIQGETASGDVQFLCTVTIEYSFTDENGGSVVSSAIGQAADKGDKGMAKAMSGAYKYAICQLLCIPYAETDPDATIPPRFRTSVTFKGLQQLKRDWWQSLGPNKPPKENAAQTWYEFVESIAQDNFEGVDPEQHKTWPMALFKECTKAVDDRLRLLTSKATKG